MVIDRAFFFSFCGRNNGSQKWLASSAIFCGMRSTTVLRVYS
jgi:hypothetical protein